MNKTTYYQKNKDKTIESSKIILWKKNQKLCESKQKNKYRELSNEEKDKKENMKEIDIKICLKKINKN